MATQSKCKVYVNNGSTVSTKAKKDSKTAAYIKDKLTLLGTAIVIPVVGMLWMGAVSNQKSQREAYVNQVAVEVVSAYENAHTACLNAGGSFQNCN